jgi:hypothetical protein
MSPRGASLLFGGLNLATAALVAFGVFVGLKSRWWPVDTAAAAIALLQLLSGAGLLAVYGPVGKGGAIVLVLVAALALPYLVVLPLAQLVWLRPRSREV